MSSGLNTFRMHCVSQWYDFVAKARDDVETLCQALEKTEDLCDWKAFWSLALLMSYFFSQVYMPGFLSSNLYYKYLSDLINSVRADEFVLASAPGQGVASDLDRSTNTTEGSQAQVDNPTPDLLTTCTFTLALLAFSSFHCLSALKSIMFNSSSTHTFCSIVSGY